MRRERSESVNELPHDGRDPERIREMQVSAGAPVLVPAGLRDGYDSSRTSPRCIPTGPRCRPTPSVAGHWGREAFHLSHAARLPTNDARHQSTCHRHGRSRMRLLAMPNRTTTTTTKTTTKVTTKVTSTQTTPDIPRRGGFAGGRRRASPTGTVGRRADKCGSMVRWQK
jgi:hypothetical protein